MIYKVDFYINLCGATDDEVNEVTEYLNENCELLLNKKVNVVNSNDETYYTCKTEKRLIPKLLVVLCERYNIEHIEIDKWY
jgi:hypothetical protein